jgi:uncharacterized protein YndB with AHSA1/START domain
MVAMTSNETALTLPTDEQILITRAFDVPKHLIYEAWTTPELIKRWWSANHGEVRIIDSDLRVGGSWRYEIVAHDQQVAFHGKYREIVPNERIVATEVCESTPQGEALNTLTFTDVNGRTTMTILMQHTSKEDRDAHLNSGIEPGIMHEAMNLLEQVAASLR